MRQACLGEGAHGRGGCGAAIYQAVDAQRLGDLVADPQDGVQRHGRVLGHQADPRAAHHPQIPFTDLGQIGASEHHATTVDLSARRQQPEHGVGGRALAGTGPADQRDDLTRPHGETDPPHGMNHPETAAVRHLQVVDLQYRHLRGRRRTDDAARCVLIRCVRAWTGHRGTGPPVTGHRTRAHSPSSAREMRLAASTVSAMVRPGSVDSHQDVAR